MDSEITQMGLFDQDTVALGELYQALERLDFRSAEKTVTKYLGLAATKRELTWELDVLSFVRKIGRRKLDLDSGYQLWADFSSRLFFREIPKLTAERIQKSFFSRLLAANRSLFEETRTGVGRSIGELYLLAGQPKNARRLLWKELKQYGENWQTRLHLGNANVLLKEIRGARASFRQAYLLGMPELSYEDVFDEELRDFLRDVDDTAWAFSEAFVSGILRTPPFSTRPDFDVFYRTFATDRSEHKSNSEAKAHRFFVLLIVSQNRRFCEEGLLVEARKEMKQLNPRLHAEYMRTLE